MRGRAKSGPELVVFCFAPRLSAIPRLLREPKEQKAVPFGSGNLAGNRAQRLVPPAAELEALVERLHDVCLASVVLNKKTARQRQPRIVHRRDVSRYFGIEWLGVAAPGGIGADTSPKRAVARQREGVLPDVLR